MTDERRSGSSRLYAKDGKIETEYDRMKRQKHEIIQRNATKLDNAVREVVVKGRERLEEYLIAAIGTDFYTLRDFSQVERYHGLQAARVWDCWRNIKELRNSYEVY